MSADHPVDQQETRFAERREQLIAHGELPFPVDEPWEQRLAVAQRVRRLRTRALVVFLARQIAASIAADRSTAVKGETDAAANV